MLLVSFRDIESPDVPGMIIDSVSNVKAGDIYKCYNMGIPCYFLVYDREQQETRLLVPEKIVAVTTGSDTEIQVYFDYSDDDPMYSGITTDFLHLFNVG